MLSSTAVQPYFLSLLRCQKKAGVVECGRHNRTSSPWLPPALRGSIYFEEVFVAGRNRIRENPSGSIAAVLDTSVQDLLGA